MPKSDQLRMILYWIMEILLFSKNNVKNQAPKTYAERFISGKPFGKEVLWYKTQLGGGGRIVWRCKTFRKKIEDIRKHVLKSRGG